MKKMKNYILIAVSIFTLLINSSSTVVFAAPQAPQAPDAPQSQNEQPEAPQAPDAPTVEGYLNGNQSSENGNNEENNDQTENQESENGEETTTQEENSATQNSVTTPTPAPDTSEVSGEDSGNQSGNQTDDGAAGSTVIDTGDATNSVGIISSANNNLSANNGSSNEGASVINSGNGTGSVNDGSIVLSEDNQTFQDNDASVLNNLEQTTTTGQNSASDNVGDSEITTGDANTSGTIVTSVNTNVDGVAVSEFNVEDNHVGDIVLDFATGCVSGCGIFGNLAATNTGNGSDSDNDADIAQVVNNGTFQNNDADIENNMILGANSGDNIASRNTGGDSQINTGDANVSANALTFANNNLAGNVIYSVVNIFGDLVGDIIFPEGTLSSAQCVANCNSNVLASNTGNGTGSTNNTSVDQALSDQTLQFNAADIENNLIIDANTANNSASGNTGGNTSIETGDVNVDAQVLNVANSNVSGGDMWLVLVNEAGNWIGKILGADPGASFAGSSGTEFSVDQNGQITATNSGNGTESNNNSNVSSELNNTTTQTNTAKLVNNLNLAANTGGNSTNNNTGGNSEITTGDANVVANLVNFVNNNVSTNGRLFVTVVNVFGSWMGDFVSPGTAQEEENNQPLGGQNVANGGEGNQNSTNSSQNNNSSSSSQNSSQGTNTLTLAGNQVNTSGSNSSKTGGIGNSASGGSLGQSEDVASQVTPQVAGFKTDLGNVLGVMDNSSQKGNSESLKVNLAWVIIILPAILLMLVLSRKLISKKLNFQRR